MLRKVKALLLTAFVLPGLGQIYLGRKLKGILLISLTNIFIIVAIVVVLKALAPIMAESAQTGIIDPLHMFWQAHAAPSVTWVLYLFLALWGYGVIDILFDNAELPEESSEQPQS